LCGLQASLAPLNSFFCAFFIYHSVYRGMEF
jgi:hypothetical protein